VIGARWAIKPKRRDDWIVTSNLYGGIVGDPSSKKSPAMDIAQSANSRTGPAHGRGGYQSWRCGATVFLEIRGGYRPFCQYVGTVFLKNTRLRQTCLVDTAMKVCHRHGDGEAAREEMCRQCLELPQRLQADLPGAFPGPIGPQREFPDSATVNRPWQLLAIGG
jgi:hypothetical protein